jgi:hypothetical protein
MKIVRNETKHLQVERPKQNAIINPKVSQSMTCGILRFVTQAYRDLLHFLVQNFFADLHVALIRMLIH